MKNIHLASAILIDDQNRFLTVRKKGSVYFMMAGGKIEPNETPLEALKRELHEELSLQIIDQTVSFVGKHSSVAVNEKDTMVHADIFKINIANIPIQNSAEIEEIKWLTLNNYKETRLAHLLTEFSLPLWLASFE